MIRRIYATDDSAATTILTLVLGIVFFAHGAQKMSRLQRAFFLRCAAPEPILSRLCDASKLIAALRIDVHCRRRACLDTELLSSLMHANSL
jgi:hypothetical protein